MNIVCKKWSTTKSVFTSLPGQEILLLTKINHWMNFWKLYSIIIHKIITNNNLYFILCIKYIFIRKALQLFIIDYHLNNFIYWNIIQTNLILIYGINWNVNTTYDLIMISKLMYRIFFLFSVCNKIVVFKFY